MVDLSALMMRSTSLCCRRFWIDDLIVAVTETLNRETRIETVSIKNMLPRKACSASALILLLALSFAVAQVCVGQAQEQAAVPASMASQHHLPTDAAIRDEGR